MKKDLALRINEYTNKVMKTNQEIIELNNQLLEKQELIKSQPDNKSEKV